MIPEHILIFSAVSEEVNSLYPSVDNQQHLVIGGRNVTTGTLYNSKVMILSTGPGIANTIQAVTACIEKKRPGLMIQTGIAGAFRDSNLSVGDIGIASEEIDVQLGIEAESEGEMLPPLPFPILQKQKIAIRNRYPFHSNLTNAAFTILNQYFSTRNIKIKIGPFITVSTITASDKRAQQLSTHYQACMESMEGAAASHLSLYYEIPLIEIRSASNMVGKRELSQWNIPLACANCSEAVRVILKNLPQGFNREFK